MTEYLSDSIYCQAQSRRPLATIPCHQRRSRVAKATAILLVLASSNTQAFIAAPLGAGVAVAGAAPRARSNQSSGWASAGTSHDTRGLTGSMLVSTRRSTAAGGLCVARVARRTSILGKWALKRWMVMLMFVLALCRCMNSTVPESRVCADGVLWQVGHTHIIRCTLQYVEISLDFCG